MLSQIIGMVIVSALLSLSAYLRRGLSFNWIGVAILFGSFSIMIGLPALFAVATAGPYWLIKGRPMPGLKPAMWTVWILFAGLVT